MIYIMIVYLSLEWFKRKLRVVATEIFASPEERLRSDEAVVKSSNSATVDAQSELSRFPSSRYTAGPTTIAIAPPMAAKRSLPNRATIAMSTGAATT